jgi:PAS domain S-box-containing protein
LFFQLIGEPQMIGSEGLAAAEHAERVETAESAVSIQRIMDRTSVGLARLDCDWRIRYANEAFRGLFTRGVGSIEGLSLEEVIPTDLFREIEHDVARAFGGECVTIDRTVVHLPAGPRFVIGDCSADIDPDGRVAGAALVLLDATQSTLAAHAHESSERKYRRIFDTCRDGIFIANGNGRIVDANDAFLQMIGRDRDTLGTLIEAEMTPEKWRSDVDAKAQHQLRQRGFTDEYEKEFRRSDGTIVPVGLRASMLTDDQGQPKDYVAVVRDISERQAADKALHASEAAAKLLQERFDAALGTINEGLAIYDKDERLVGFNERYRDLFPAAADLCVPGAQFEDLIRRSVLGGDHSGFGDVEQRITEIVENFRRHEISERQLRDNRWIEARDYEAPDGGTVCIRIDITAHKRIEQALRESESMFKAVFENAAVGITSASLNGRFTTANRALETMLGYDKSELRRLSWQDITHPDDLRNSIEASQALMRKGVPQVRFEKRFLRRDGGIVWADMALTALRDAEGRPEAELCVVQDITEKKTAEDRLRAALDRFNLAAQATNDGLFDVDLVTSAIWYSKRSRELLGIPDDPDAQTFDTWIARVHPDDREQIECAHAELIERDVQYSVEYRFAVAPDQYRWFHSNGVVQRDHRGRALRMVGTNRDITERKESEERLRHAQKMETIGRLTGGVAHEFNNLLTAIGGFAHMIDAKADDPETSRSFAQEIIDASDQAASLTSQLLAFSRKQVLDPEIVSGREIVDRLQPLVRQTIGERIRLQVEHASGEPWVEVDRHQLAQALLNLAINARDAMPNGGSLVIGCRTTRLDGDEIANAPGGANRLPAGDYCAIFVRDTGCGMDPSVVNRIFEPFFTTKPLGSGTGLGLSMVYGMVQQSGGTVAVESTLGEGTTITIYLPLRQAAAIAAKPPAVLAPAERRTATILIAEDERQVRDLARLALEEDGYAVLAANGGNEALTLWRERPDIDLLITDVVMPDMTGPALACDLRRDRPSLKVIFVSGYPRTENGTTENEAILEECCFLPKPFTPDDLLGSVRRALTEDQP